MIHSHMISASFCMLAYKIAVIIKVTLSRPTASTFVPVAEFHKVGETLCLVETPVVSPLLCTAPS